MWLTLCCRVYHTFDYLSTIFRYKKRSEIISDHIYTLLWESICILRHLKDAEAGMPFSSDPAPSVTPTGANGSQAACSYPAYANSTFTFVPAYSLIKALRKRISLTTPPIWRVVREFRRPLAINSGFGIPGSFFVFLRYAPNDET